MKLEEFRIIYEELAKKHKLPGFEEMNSAFEIGRIKRDSGSLLRDVRRIMGEKVSYFMRLIEVMINPSQAPPTFLMLLKEITKEDKKLLDSVFSAFMELELGAYKLNISSDDEQEANEIIKIHRVWFDKKKELQGIMSILEKNWKQVSNVPKLNKGYFN